MVNMNKADIRIKIKKAQRRVEMSSAHRRANVNKDQDKQATAKLLFSLYNLF